MCGRQTASTGDTGPLHQCHGQRLLAQHSLEELAKALRIGSVLLLPGVTQRAQVLQVRTGRKVLAGPRQQHRAHSLGPQIASIELGQLGNQSGRQGVGPIGIVELDPQQIAILPHLQALV